MDWPLCRQVERQARRTREMIERLDVDVGRLVRLGEGAAYAEACDRCLNCVNTRECLAWLDAGGSGAPRPDFCPNAALFEGLARTDKTREAIEK